MRIRPYADADAASSLELFRRAVRMTAARDYTSEQLSAWAPEDLSLTRWAEHRRAADTVVAELDGCVIGFTDLDAEGFIDMMYVDPDMSRRGVATALLDHVVARARERGIEVLSTHASITARPFFEKHGFVVVSERKPVRRGVTLTNFHMRRKP